MPKIETFRKTFQAEICAVKYYDELDFLDLFQNLNGIKRKKSKELKDITNTHCIGYFLDGKLIRIDSVGGQIPRETYLIYENENIKEAHEFFLGSIQEKKIINTVDLHSSWFYFYENNVLNKIKWIHYEDRKYYDHPELTSIYDYEYDAKGLLFIHQTIKGKAAFWRKPVISVATIYDRERELFLKECTITQSPLVNTITNISDNVIDFKIHNNTKSCSCFKCGKILTYIASINLLDKRFNSKKIFTTSLPILYCFDCLEDQEYKPVNLNREIENRKAFTEGNYKFKSSIVSEILIQAFLKIGGQPIWVQNDEHPKCSNCQGTMKFVMEMKTDEELTNGEEALVFGDDGKLYVFACCDFVKIISQWH